tara:strand:- start:754 stop:1209 length:456 start_codon:yes stop_codon:yes gene_type:complete
MGYNSVIFVLNDAIGGINNDPKQFWEDTEMALNGHVRGHRHAGQRLPLSYPVGNHANGATAVWNQHADTTGLIAVGGNHVTILAESYNGGKHHQEEDQVALLKLAAEKLGYDLVPKGECCMCVCDHPKSEHGIHSHSCAECGCAEYKKKGD